MTVKKLSKLTEKLAQRTTGPIGIVGPSDTDMRWRAQSALRTIHEAEEHRKDKELMRHVKKMAKDQAKACGIK